MGFIKVSRMHNLIRKRAFPVGKPLTHHAAQVTSTASLKSLRPLRSSHFDRFAQVTSTASLSSLVRLRDLLTQRRRMRAEESGKAAGKANL